MSHLLQSYPFGQVGYEVDWQEGLFPRGLPRVHPV